MPETFSSEIGDVHQRPGDRPSFTDEFEGASDSLIDRDRPERPSDIGRRGRRIVFWSTFTLALLGGGGFAIWYWAEPIAGWLASVGRLGEAPQAIAEAEPEPAQAEPAQAEPAEPETVSPPDPIVAPPIVPDGAPLPVEPLDRPAGDSLPVEPLDGAAPSKIASVAVETTTVRGRVSSASVGSKLAAVDEAVERCWTAAAAKPGTARPVTMTLSFTIKWNGQLLATSLDGDAPEAVERCAREALPGRGWPQPRDGGEARVTRSWTLE